MSDGLKLLTAIIDAGSSSSLLKIDPEMMLDREVDAFEFMRGHYRAYRSIPTAETVLAETGIRLPSIRESLQFYVDKVEDRYVYGQVQESYTQLREAMSTRDMDAVANVVQGMHTATRRTAQRGGALVTIGQAVGMAHQRLLDTHGLGGVTGITSGYSRLDEITGGWQNSDLISIVARPSIGKTYELLQMARLAQAAGHSVLIISTEMGAEQLGRRYVALELGINPTALKMNTLGTYMMRRVAALGAQLVEMEGFRIFCVGMKARVNAIEGLIQEFDPDIVMIDGAYLLHPSVKGNLKRIERVAEVVDELKHLTIDSNKPIIQTTQLNREAGKDGKQASLETIGFTDAIGQHSSIVMALEYGPTPNPRLSRNFKFLKGREGEVGFISKHFRFAPLNFNEFTAEEQAQYAEEGEGNEGSADDVSWMAGGNRRAAARRADDPPPNEDQNGHPE